MLAKLNILDDEINARNSLAEEIKKIQIKRDLKFPVIDKNSYSSYGQFTIIDENRDELKQVLSQIEIPSMIHYPKPLNQQPAVYCNASHTPVSNRLSSQVLSLPLPIYANNIDNFLENLGKVL